MRAKRKPSSSATAAATRPCSAAFVATAWGSSSVGGSPRATAAQSMLGRAPADHPSRWYYRSARRWPECQAARDHLATILRPGSPRANCGLTIAKLRRTQAARLDSGQLFDDVDAAVVPPPVSYLAHCHHGQCRVAGGVEAPFAQDAVVVPRGENRVAD